MDSKLKSMEIPGGVQLESLNCQINCETVTMDKGFTNYDILKNGKEMIFMNFKNMKLIKLYF